jgi:WD40 repeat protein
LSPDGRTILTGDEGRTARLWETATGKPLGLPLPHPGAVTAVPFRADGRVILTGSDDQAARRWDAATGQPLGTALRHRGAVRAVALSPGRPDRADRQRG